MHCADLLLNSLLTWAILNGVMQIGNTSVTETIASGVGSNLQVRALPPVSPTTRRSPLPPNDGA